MLLKDHSLRDSLTFVQKENINYERLDSKSCLIPIVKLVIFVGRVPTSNLVSTSKIGIQIEPLTPSKQWKAMIFKNHDNENNYGDIMLCKNYSKKAQDKNRK